MSGAAEKPESKSEKPSVRPKFSAKMARKQLDDFFRVQHAIFYRLTDEELQHERMTHPATQRSAICRAIQAIRSLNHHAELEQSR